jgi:myosin heavy subunit
MSKQLNTYKKNTPSARSTMAPGAASNIRTPPGFSRQTVRDANVAQIHLRYSSIGATSNSTFQPFGGLAQPHPDWTLSPKEFIVSQAATPGTPRHAFFEVPSPETPTQYHQSGNQIHDAQPDEVPVENEDMGEVTAVHEFDPEAPPFRPGFNRQPTLALSAAPKPKLESSLRRESLSLITREKIGRLTKENQELASALKKSRQAEKATKEQEYKLQEKMNTLAQKRIEMVDRARVMEATIHANTKQHAREVASLKAEIAKNRDKELLLQSANDTKVSEYKQMIQSLEAEITELQSQVKKARSEVQSELNMTELNNRHKRLTNAQLEYENQLKIKDTYLEQMQSGLDELNDDKQRLIGHAQRLQDERNQFEIEKNILTRVNKDQEVRISALLSEKAEMAKEVNDLSGVNNDHVQTISSLQEQQQSSKAEIAALVKDKDELVNKVSGHDSLEIEKNELQKANSAQAKKISLLEDEVHKLNLAHTDLLEECAKWRSKVEVSCVFCNDASASLIACTLTCFAPVEAFHRKRDSNLAR